MRDIGVEAIMATELTVQSERAFQKQPHIFLNHKGKQAKSKKLNGKGGRRWYKNVGLDFKTRESTPYSDGFWSADALE